MVLYRNKGHKQIEDGRSLSLKWTECGCGVYGRGGGGEVGRGEEDWWI